MDFYREQTSISTVLFTLSLNYSLVLACIDQLVKANSFVDVFNVLLDLIDSMDKNYVLKSKIEGK